MTPTNSSSRFPVLPVIALAVAALTLVQPSARAATNFFWTSSGPGNWSGAANWTNETATVEAPATGGQASYILNFNQAGTYTATHDLGNGFLLNQLNLGGATVSLAGHSLAPASNGALPARFNQNSTTAVAISNNISLGSNLTLGGAGSGAMSLVGVVSGSGSLAKTNSGTLTLGGAGVNTWNGGTTLSAGTLVLNQSRFNLGFGTLTLAGGSTFQTSNFEGNGPGGAITNTFNLSGGYVSMLVSFGAKDIWITGPVTGPGGLLVTGGGRAQGLTLSGAKTFSGGVTIGTVATTDGANVSIDSVNSLGTGRLRSEQRGTTLTSGGVIINSTLTSGLGLTNAIDLAPSARLVVNVQSYNALFSGPITNTGSLVKIGTATLTLSGSNTYSGATIVYAGVLACAAP